MEAYIRGLELLGNYQESCGTLLVPVIIDKLPSEMKRHLARIQKNQDWQLDALRRAVDDEITIMEALSCLLISHSTVTFCTGARSDKVKSKFASPRHSTTPLKCPCCNGDHSAIKCTQYSDSTQRLTIVKQKQLCYNCLDNHAVAKCRSTKRCLKCNKNTLPAYVKVVRPLNKLGKSR
jgi:hypothetical protein